MPELPEVETVRRGLEQLVVGRRIVGVDVLNPGSLDAPLPLDGLQVTTARRRAKMLMLDLDDGRCLAIHLKMTGQLVVRNRTCVDESDCVQVGSGADRQMEGVSVAGGGMGCGLQPAQGAQTPYSTRNQVSGYAGQASAPSPAQTGVPPTAVTFVENLPADASLVGYHWGGGHPSDSLIDELPDRSTRVIFDLDDGARLFFNDQRKFGWIRAVPRDVADGWASAYGPEPMDDDAWPRFRALVRRHAKATIKAALLDQHVVAGIGNIYADEALWGAGVHPASRVGALSDRALHRVLDEAAAVMEMSIDLGGSTARNYVDAEGRRGAYLDFARVFRREGKPCLRCGTTIVKTRVAGRGTHLCPKCQRVRNVQQAHQVH
ncbi:MAG: hypothetical protein FWD63_03315 [Propionibacteriaceae bacterium]|nr:hypothetical protein [Propionibacteriaceae bacterium]